jgi:hypothetical protein
LFVEEYTGTDYKKRTYMKPKVLFCLLFSLIAVVSVTAQSAGRVKYEQCATMQRLEGKFANDTSFRNRFELQRAQFNKAVREGLYSYRLSSRVNTANSTETTSPSNERTVINIPVVFHIVLTNPNLITDAQILAQLDTLNKDYAGANADSVKIPSYFKPLFGKSSIQFCLAQRTPEGDNTTGIERITTSQTSFSPDNDNVKRVATGGLNGWDNNKYLNVWLCVLSNNILGYATFPNDGPPEEQGVVIDYRTLPGGSFTSYNMGKTLTHETGHYFNLYHIWGDDNGSCTGSDFVDDTPNQGDATSGCPSGVKTDNCTSTAPGVMYQNYMDYTNDACMEMFTTQQVDRMESALLAYRASLLTSNGCVAPVPLNYNAQLRSIYQPPQRVCTNNFTPAVIIRNLGIQTLTSVKINTKIDSGSVSTYNWTGSLTRLATANVVLNNITIAPGNHTLTIYVSAPNNNPDEDVSNDTLSIQVQYYLPVTTVSESFESPTFPPPGWDIVNPDNSVTWKRVTGVAKTGNASVMINNFNYSSPGQKDDLRLPTVNLQNVDSAFLSFQVAAASYTALNTTGNVWDTLDVLISNDCGQNYTSLYKRYGENLVTKATPITTSFTPASDEWRKDSINLANYIGLNNILLAFRNTNGYENNIYLDDVNVRTVVINPNLKSQGFLVTPNPTSGMIAVQFYPQPINLQAIQVYNLAGQKLLQTTISGGQANNYYSLNISSYAAGTYVVRAIFTDRVIIRKIVKY